MIRLVLSDMDGTLVPFGRETVSSRTLGAIDALRAAGIRFGLASGRDWEDATSFFRGERRFLDTCIAAAGKQVRLDGKTIFEKPFSRELLLAMDAACRRRGDCVLMVFARDIDAEDPDRMCMCYVGVTQQMLDDYRKDHADLPNIYLVDEVPDQVMYTVGLIVLGSSDGWERIRNEMCAEFPGIDLVSSAVGFYDVNPDHWSKAMALPVLLEATGLGVDEVLYFGDSDNDLAIMMQLEHTFAVAGATERCAAVARYHIWSAEEDAPAAVLEALAASGGDLEAALAALGM